MTAIHQRKNGIYETQIPVRINGRTKYKSIYGKTKAEVQRKAKIALQNEYYNEHPLFQTVAEQWNDEHIKDIEYYTADGYKAPLKDLIKEFGNIPIDEITPLRIQSFLDQKARQHYAHQTVKLRLIVMNLICQYAVLHQYLETNPCLAVKVPKCKPSKKVSSPTSQDIQTMLRNVNEPFGLFPFMLYYTGCRRSELLGLKYNDIHDDYIYIRRVVIFENGQPVIRNYTKTQSGMRQIPVLPPVKEQLPSNKAGFIFTNKDHKLMTLSQFNVAWSQYKRKTGIQFTPHQLRHGFATLCYDANLNPKAAQAFLGHSKISTTLDIYTDIDKERQEGDRQALIDFIKSHEN